MYIMYIIIGSEGSMNVWYLLSMEVPRDIQEELPSRQ